MRLRTIISAFSYQYTMSMTDEYEYDCMRSITGTAVEGQSYLILILEQPYEPVTKGHDLKWDTLPQNQTPSKLFSVLPLESGMFQATISIIKKMVLIQVCAVWHQNWGQVRCGCL